MLMLAVAGLSTYVDLLGDLSRLPGLGFCAVVDSGAL